VTGLDTISIVIRAWIISQLQHKSITLLDITYYTELSARVRRSLPHF